MLIQADRATDNRRIIVKLRVPELVIEHDVRSAVWTMLIGRVEESPEMRIRTHSVEKVTADDVDPGGGDIVSSIESDFIDAEGSQILKAAVTVAQVKIVRIRLGHGMFVFVFNPVEGLRVRQIRRTKNHSVQYAENNRVGADGQSQRQDRDDREPRGFPQQTQTETDILCE